MINEIVNKIVGYANKAVNGIVNDFAFVRVHSKIKNQNSLIYSSIKIIEINLIRYML